MTMKAFLLLNEWTLSTGDHGYDTEILTNWDLARRHMQRDIKKTLEDFEGVAHEVLGCSMGDIERAADPKDLQCTVILEPEGYVAISLIEHDVID